MLPTPGVYDVEMMASAISVLHLTTPANPADPASTVTKGARTFRDAALVTAWSAASAVSQTVPTHTGRLQSPSSNCTHTVEPTAGNASGTIGTGGRQASARHAVTPTSGTLACSRPRRRGSWFSSTFARYTSRLRFVDILLLGQVAHHLVPSVAPERRVRQGAPG